MSPAGASLCSITPTSHTCPPKSHLHLWQCHGLILGNAPLHANDGWRRKVLSTRGPQRTHGGKGTRRMAILPATAHALTKGSFMLEKSLIISTRGFHFWTSEVRFGGEVSRSESSKLGCEERERCEAHSNIRIHPSYKLHNLWQHNLGLST